MKVRIAGFEFDVASTDCKADKNGDVFCPVWIV